MSRPADVAAAVEAGADAIGFVFYPPSPRAVSVEQAAALAAELPPFVTPVGLFVNADRAQVRAATAAIPALVLQFHGDEAAAACGVHGRPYLKAVRMEPGVVLLDWFRVSRALPPFCSTLRSRASAAVERCSIGRSRSTARKASAIGSFCLVGCMPETSGPASRSFDLTPLT